MVNQMVGFAVEQVVERFDTLAFQQGVQVHIAANDRCFTQRAVLTKTPMENTGRRDVCMRVSNGRGKTFRLAEGKQTLKQTDKMRLPVMYGMEDTD